MTSDRTLSRISNGIRYGGWCVIASLVLAAAVGQPAMATQSKSFVVSWFHVASFRQDGDCPKGLAIGSSDLYRRILKDKGYSQADIDDIVSTYANDPQNFEGGDRNAIQIGAMRGMIDGKPASAYTYPESVPDPHIPVSEGPYAAGFNLDGKGAASPNSFEDPETHEKGINDQLYRATGCIKPIRAGMPERPMYPSNQWSLNRNIMPAWLIVISGDDLSKDGDITVTFDKALEHVTLDAQLEAMRDATYRIAPDPRAHIVVKGKIKDGVVTVDAPFHLAAQFDASVYPVLDLYETRLRLKVNSDGTLEGYAGGYQPWLQFYFLFAQAGAILEAQIGLDIPGLYYSLKRLADYAPDPQTGQNTAISATYRIEAVPAFTVTPEAETTKLSQAR